MPRKEKYVLVSLKGEKSKKIAESISNKTSRKILDYLSNKEDIGAEAISKKLKIPISTIDYNLKNLKKAGLIENKYFVWSEKGRKITLYNIVKKLIIISPNLSNIKKEIKNIVPAILGIAIISAIIQHFTKLTSNSPPIIKDNPNGAFNSIDPGSIQSVPNYGLIFFLGALSIIIIYLLIKIIKRK